TPAAPPASFAREFEYRLDFGPRVTVGAVLADGLGVRTSWWRIDQSARVLRAPPGNPRLSTTLSPAPVAGLPGFTSPGPVGRAFGIASDQFGFDDRVRPEVWDWEAFRDFQWDRWSLRLAGGGRYGRLPQGYRAFRFNSGSTGSGATRVTLTEDSDVV